VLVLAVCAHLLIMAGSSLRYTPVGPPLREYTRPFEQALGMHQTWPMFGNPPRTTTWLVMHGVDADGPVELPQLLDPPDFDGVIWRYQRRHKFVRNALSDKRKYLRAAVVRWYCRQAKAQGHDLHQVVFDKVVVRTPGPYKGDADRHGWREKRETIEAWNCKR